MHKIFITQFVYSTIVNLITMSECLIIKLSRLMFAGHICLPMSESMSDPTGQLYLYRIATTFTGTIILYTYIYIYEKIRQPH